MEFKFNGYELALLKNGLYFYIKYMEKAVASSNISEFMAVHKMNIETLDDLKKLESKLRGY